MNSVSPPTPPCFQQLHVSQPVQLMYQSPFPPHFFQNTIPQSSPHSSLSNTSHSFTHSSECTQSIESEHFPSPNQPSNVTCQNITSISPAHHSEDYPTSATSLVSLIPSTVHSFSAIPFNLTKFTLTTLTP